MQDWESTWGEERGGGGGSKASVCVKRASVCMCVKGGRADDEL